MPKGYSDKPRMRRGNAPPDGTRVAEHPDGWVLYERYTADKGGSTWSNMKLVMTGEITRKANYWLSFNLTTRQFCMNRDLRLLDTNEPGLIEWAETEITRWHDRGEPDLEDLMR